MATEQINRIKYQPAAKPVDTVGVDTSFQPLVAPVAPVRPLAPQHGDLPNPPMRDNRAEQLVTALAGFSKGISGILGTMDEERRKNDEREAEFAAMKSSANTWEEAVRADPSLATKSPFFKDVFEGRIASTSMQRRIGEIQAEYYNSDIKNSTDPSAIQKWFVERIMPTLDSFKNPAERQAAIDMATKQAAAFAQAHATNASNNLIKQNTESFGAAVTSDLDAHGRKPAAKAYPVGAVAVKDATPEQKAFLAAIAGGESAGRYDNRFSAGQGLTIDVSKPHDGRMFQGPDGPSSASGKYMFTVSTWKHVHGGANPVMSEENQDKAALAYGAEVYKDLTGHDLWEDIKKEGFSNRIQSILSPTWKALESNRARHAATYNEVLKSGGSQLPDSPSADPNLDETAASIYDKANLMRKQGVPQEKVDEDTVQAVINSAITNRDPSHLKILDIGRGTLPALGLDPKVRTRIMAAQEHIRSISVTEANAAETLRKQRQEVAKDNLKRAVFAEVIDKQNKGVDPTISQDQLKNATALDPDLFTLFTSVNKTLAEANRDEDPAVMNELSRQMYTGQMTVEDVFKQVATGQLRNPQTISRFYQEAQQNAEKSYLTGPIISRAMGQVDQFLNDPNKFDFEKRAKSLEAQSLLRKEFKEFMDKNPKATLREQDDFVQSTMQAILGESVDSPSKMQQDAMDKRKAAKAAAEPAKADPEKTGAVVPPDATNAPKGNLEPWKTTSVFNDDKGWKEAFAQYQKDRTGPFREAMLKFGIDMKNQDAIREFVTAQAGLLRSKLTSGK